MLPGVGRWSALREKGFTLVELLVAVAIIAILVALLLPTLARAKDQAMSARCLSGLKQMANASAAYTAEYDNYLFPDNWASWSVTGVGSGAAIDIRGVFSTYLAMPDWVQADPNRFNIWTCPSIKVDMKGSGQQWPTTYGANCMPHPRLNANPTLTGQPWLIKASAITRPGEIISIADTAQLSTGTSQGFIDGTSVSWPNGWWSSVSERDKPATPPGEPTIDLANRDFASSRVRYRHLGESATNAFFLDGHAETMKFPIYGRNLSLRY